ncbi:MAG: aminomethyl-transferring glycine dehydrogenase subunit GcvPB, partial [Rhabdaerophilum sp.]
MLNNQGRPTSAGEASETSHPTFTGNRALMVEEALLFEVGRADTTGVDVAPAKKVKSRLGGQERKAPIGLVGLSE